ncbi:MAG: hypothetical protein NTW48_10755 [Chloroflexi bacterium]|nr:hypothetical protein [Chloroflexota bacterium]
MKKWYNITAISVVMVIVLGMFAMACAPKAAPPQPTGPITINIGEPVALSGSASPWGQIPTPFREAWFEVFNKEGCYSSRYQPGESYLCDQVRLSGCFACQLEWCI